MTDQKPKDIVARYKIEVHFGKNRTLTGPNVAAVSVFESGMHLNGDGDELMYICAQRDKGLALNAPNVKDSEIIRGQEGCGKFIPGKNLQNGVAMCVCEKQRMISSEELTSTVLVNLTTERIANLVANWFRKLDNNADIYVKYHPTDIRYKAMESAEGLDKARSLRGLTIYPLKNIIKDTANGASIEKRFFALFTA
jgi:hypothetical protein